MSDFTSQPPETISALLRAGPGSAPMLAAASAWDELSQGLCSTVSAHIAATTALATIWMGPSAQCMSHAALRYRAWLTAAARHAERAAACARAAGNAYDAARTASVAPEAVAANRARLAALSATNTLGHNAAAIAATEAEYAGMWAQDSAAMIDYQSASQAAVAGLQQFTLPNVLNPNNVPVFGLDSGSLAGYYLGDLVQSGFFFDVPLQLLSLFTVLWGVDSASPLVQAVVHPPPVLPEAVLPPLLPAPTPAAAELNVRVGAGVRVGQLRVPPSWAQAPASPRRPGGVPLAVAEDTITLPAPVPIPLGAARGTPTKQPRPEPQFGTPLTFMTRPPSGG
jgi:PPE-repeat protein